MNDGPVIAIPAGPSSRVPRDLNGSTGVFTRLDGIAGELDQLAAGTVELASAVDGQAEAIVAQLAALAGRLDYIELTVNNTALTVALMAPPVADSLGIVLEAQKVGWRRAWKARRKAAKAAKRQP